MLNGAAFDTSSQGRQQTFRAIVEMSAKMREARLAVYSISTGALDATTDFYQEYLKGVKLAEKANPPNLSLKVLAVQSGGRALSPSNDLTGDIGSCVQDATAFYTISFDPPRADKPNEYHDLKVQIDQPGLKARTNTGYYNQP